MQRLTRGSSEGAELVQTIEAGTGLKAAGETARDVLQGNRGALRGIIKRYRQHPWSDAALAKTVKLQDSREAAILLEVIREYAPICTDSARPLLRFLPRSLRSVDPERYRANYFEKVANTGHREERGFSCAVKLPDQSPHEFSWLSSDVFLSPEALVVDAHSGMVARMKSAMNSCWQALQARQLDPQILRLAAILGDQEFPGLPHPFSEERVALRDQAFNEFKQLIEIDRLPPVR